MRDERAEQEAFVELCGGTSKADWLMRIWEDSYPVATHDIFVKLSREDVFRHKARMAKFSVDQINAFLRLS